MTSLHPSPRDLEQQLRDYVSNVKVELARRDIRLRKRLGQHLLQDARFLRGIAEAAASFEAACIFEVGTGPGNLTGALCALAPRVVGVEISPELYAIAQDLLSGYPNLQLHLGDVLSRPLSTWVNAPDYCLASNVPYCISGPLLARLVLQGEGLRGAVLMLQREVADRILATPGDSAYSSLTVLISTFFKVESLFKVPASAFLPNPRVTSSVICLQALAEPLLGRDRVHVLETVVRAAFGSRRKFVLNSLRHHLKSVPREQLEAGLLAAQIKPEQRAQTVPVARFVAFVEALQSFGVEVG